MKFMKIIAVAVILAFAGLAFAQQAQEQKKKPAKQSHTMMKKAEASKMSKEECAKMDKAECAKMGNEECAKMEKMKTHGSMAHCGSDSTKSTDAKNCCPK
jgi:uncharacterized protein HemX